MAKPRVVLAIYIKPKAGRGKMRERKRIFAVAYKGLVKDRYWKGKGSYSQGKVGRRQVTLINATAFEGTIFSWEESLRNIITQGVELNRLLGRSRKPRAGQLEIGDEVILRAVKYCYPCDVPSIRCKKPGFALAFEEKAGVIFEVLNSGFIRVGDRLVPHYA